MWYPHKVTFNVKDLLLPTPPRTWRRRTGGELKTWATTTKADQEPISGPRVFGHARWRKDWVKVSCELAQDRRAWNASIRDVVNAIGDAGSTRPGWMPTQVQVQVSIISEEFHFKMLPWPVRDVANYASCTSAISLPICDQIQICFLYRNNQTNFICILNYAQLIWSVAEKMSLYACLSL